MTWKIRWAVLRDRLAVFCAYKVGDIIKLPFLSKKKYTDLSKTSKIRRVCDAYIIRVCKHTGLSKNIQAHPSGGNAHICRKLQMPLYIGFLFVFFP